MTKKSAARMARDATKEQLKDNRCWDELNQIFDDARVMLYQHTVIGTLAGNSQLQSCLENPSSTANSIRILGNDLKSLNEQLTSIRSKHAGKTGGSQNPDEVWNSILIGQEYAQLMETHSSVVQPTALKILEDFQYAEKKLNNLIAQQQNLAAKSNDVVDAQVIH